MDDNVEKPVVSVVMAANNEECRIASAIQSIMEQTFTNWEFIVVDDASSDNTVEIIKQFQKSDSRIKLMSNKINTGLAASLNCGIASSRGEYIARMDADDISYPERLRLQTEFLDAHPEIAVVGGNADFVDESGSFIRKSNMPTSPLAIKRVITKMNPLIHPSVLFRRDFLETMEGYDGRLRRKQDYDLWLRGCNRYQYANLEDVVMSYTVQLSKPLITDLYGFYVRCLNAFRQRNLAGFFWAFLALGINVITKLGYRQRSYRKEICTNKKPY